MKLNRRQFLQQTSAAAVFAATPGLAYTQAVGSDGPFDDYKALVCVFLFGGNDSFNMLVPRSASEYAVYAESRQNLAIANESLLPVVPATPTDMDFGLHPSMPGVQQLFESGSAAFVANVGPLIAPVTKDSIFAGSAPLPPQLFSHNDQQDQWTSLKGRDVSSTGWAGRMADLIRNGVTDQRMATNASLFGNNLWQSADSTVAYVMGPGGPLQFEGFSTEPDTPGFVQQQVFERILAADHASMYADAFADVQSRSIAAAGTVTSAIEGAPEFATEFPSSVLGTQLQTVARLIAVRDELEMRRQIFFVAAGGFDSHDNQNEDQPNLLGDVSACMAAFHAATNEIGMAESVTAFTQSDFGRTLTSNGDGTDHAWGGNQLVVGGAVAGGDIYGDYPLLQIDGDLDVGGGRLIPTTSADQYAATLASWFGIADVDLGVVAPNIDNFTARNLGFMAG